MVLGVKGLINNPPLPKPLVVVAKPTNPANGTILAPAPVYFEGGVPGTAAATVSVAGTVKRAAAQANSTATDVAGLVTDFNALLAKLRTAGILAP